MNNNNKRVGRLTTIQHALSLLPYRPKDEGAIGVVRSDIVAPVRALLPVVAPDRLTHGASRPKESVMSSRPRRFGLAALLGGAALGEAALIHLGRTYGSTLDERAMHCPETTSSPTRSS